jgi:hypothetical protein
LRNSPSIPSGESSDDTGMLRPGTQSRPNTRGISRGTSRPTTSQTNKSSVSDMTRTGVSLPLDLIYDTTYEECYDMLRLMEESLIPEEEEYVI